MAVLITDKTRVIVQGITGNQGSFHAQSMKSYGTKVVAGVTPGKGGQEVHGIPVRDTVKETVAEFDANASVIFVPARFTFQAAMEAIEADIEFVTIITEHVPVWDALKIMLAAKERNVHVLGPNCPGGISPGYGKIGIIPSHIVEKGDVGLVSRSGTLTYEVIRQLTRSKLGQSSCIGIGGDPVRGIGFIDMLDLFEEDKDTKKIVMVGEIGGTAEEEAAQHIKESISKQVVAYIAGKTAPPGKKLGHAGAIIQGGKGTASSKIEALEKADVQVVTEVAKISASLH